MLKREPMTQWQLTIVSLAAVAIVVAIVLVGWHIRSTENIATLQRLSDEGARIVEQGREQRKAMYPDNPALW